MISFLLTIALVAAAPNEAEARLDKERAALEALSTNKKDVLGVLDVLSRLVKENHDRVTKLEKSLELLRSRIETARNAATAARVEKNALEKAMAPRFLSLYKYKRARDTAEWVSATNIETLIRTERAQKQWVKADMRDLRALAQLSRYAERTVAYLAHLESVSKSVERALMLESRIAQARRRELTVLLYSIENDANQQKQLVHQLENAEKNLSRMVRKLDSEKSASGFAALRGKLLHPVKDGLVEVGFGKVVNPRFNTVTIQKGIDVRAPKGTPVRAVADGKVAYTGWLKGYGALVILDHGSGFHSLMAHLGRMTVVAGDKVNADTVIGEVGDTASLKGDYLYFELRKEGVAIDPLPWLKNEAVR